MMTLRNNYKKEINNVPEKKKKRKLSKKNTLQEESGSSSVDESYHSDVFTEISLSGITNATSDSEKPVLPRNPRHLNFT